MRNRIITGISSGILLLASALLGGCAMRRLDLVETGRVHVENIPSSIAYLQAPNLWQEEGQFVVTGNVTRPMPYNGTMLVGHVHVALWKDGKELDNHWAPWTPWSIPVKPPYLSHYTVRQEVLPPEGAVVRVYVCSQDHPPVHSQTVSPS